MLAYHSKIDYFKYLTNFLSNEDKKILIELLSKPEKTKNNKNKLLGLFGKLQDVRTAEEIISDIYNSRIYKDELIEL